jgi:hypothetical protein
MSHYGTRNVHVVIYFNEHPILVQNVPGVEPRQGQEVMTPLEVYVHYFISYLKSIKSKIYAETNNFYLHYSVGGQ